MRARKRLNRLRGANPAHHRFVPDAHLHYVVAAEVAVMPPMEGRARLDEAGGVHRAVVDHEVHGQHVAEVAFGNQALDRLVNAQRHGGRHNLRYQVGRESGCVQHFARLRRVHRHARFGLHMLIAFQRGQHHIAVHIRPCADADGVRIVRLYELDPVVVHLGQAVLVCDALPGRAAAIGDAHKLHALDRLKSGDMPKFGVAARPHETYPDNIVCHLRTAPSFQFKERVSPRASCAMRTHSFHTPKFAPSDAEIA